MFTNLTYIWCRAVIFDVQCHPRWEIHTNWLIYDIQDMTELRLLLFTTLSQAYFYCSWNSPNYYMFCKLYFQHVKTQQSNPVKYESSQVVSTAAVLAVLQLFQLLYLVWSMFKSATLVKSGTIKPSPFQPEIQIFSISAEIGTFQQI